MSEDNITSPGNESHQLQTSGLDFDCAGIIEQVIENTSAKHANTMATIVSTMENQQQQMNKITDILAGISQFLVQGNLGQDTPNNGIPPSTSQQQSLGQTTPEQIPPIEMTEMIMIRASKQTIRATILHLELYPIQVKSQ